MTGPVIRPGLTCSSTEATRFPEDRAFIAASRHDIPALVQAVRERDATIARAVKLLGMITDNLGNRPADIAAFLAEIGGRK
jgi:hypothetical protein